MFELSRQDSDIIKGIAIILMFVHHFFCFPTWYIEGISYPQLAGFAEFFRFPTRICVSVFAFMTGYAYGERKAGGLAYSARKISDLYIGYWCVFIPLFILAAALKNDNLSFGNFLVQLFGANSNTMIFAWYVPFYAAAMIALPVVARCGKGSRVIFIMTAFAATKYFSQVIVWNTDVPWIRNVINDFQGTFPIVAIGYYCSNWKGFHKLQAVLDTDKKAVSIAVFLMIIILAFCSKAYTRIFKLGEMYFKDGIIDMSYSTDLISVPLFIWAVVNIIHMIGQGRLMMRILEELGRKSMMMWLVSCAFFSNSSQLLQPFLYWPRNPVLVILWGCLLCYLISAVLTTWSKRLCRLKNRVLNIS